MGKTEKRAATEAIRRLVAQSLKLAQRARLRPMGQVRIQVRWTPLWTALTCGQFGVHGLAAVEQDRGRIIVYLPPYPVWCASQLWHGPGHLPPSVVGLVLHEVAHLCNARGAVDEVLSMPFPADGHIHPWACQHGPGWRGSYAQLVAFATGVPLPAETAGLAHHQDLEAAVVQHLERHGWLNIRLNAGPRGTYKKSSGFFGTMVARLPWRHR